MVGLSDLLMCAVEKSCYYNAVVMQDTVLYKTGQQHNSSVCVCACVHAYVNVFAHACVWVCGCVFVIQVFRYKSVISVFACC